MTRAQQLVLAEQRKTLELLASLVRRERRIKQLLDITGDQPIYFNVRLDWLPFKVPVVWSPANASFYRGLSVPLTASETDRALDYLLG